MPTLVSSAPVPETAAQEPALSPQERRNRSAAYESFFGTLAPVDKLIVWCGHANTVTLRVLEADESRACYSYAATRAEGQPTDAPDYVLAEWIARTAFCLVAVDGVRVDSECRTLAERLQLAADMPNPLLDAIMDAYAEVYNEPIAFLAEMDADPSSAAARTPSGS